VLIAVTAIAVIAPIVVVSEPSEAFLAAGA
jgi:hypothetical protein